MEMVKYKLRVLHFAQLPCKPFIVPVKDEYEASKIIEILACQHLFLYENKIIPDYCNILYVEMLENGEWVDYWNEEEGCGWEDLEETFELRKRDT